MAVAATRVISSKAIEFEGIRVRALGLPVFRSRPKGTRTLSAPWKQGACAGARGLGPAGPGESLEASCCCHGHGQKHAASTGLEDVAVSRLPFRQQTYSQYSGADHDQQPGSLPAGMVTKQQCGGDEDELAHERDFSKKMRPGIAQGCGMEEGSSQAQSRLSGRSCNSRSKSGSGFEQGHESGGFGRVFLVLVDLDPHVIQTNHQPSGMKPPRAQDADG